MIKQFYLSGENAAKTVQVYLRNHKLRRSLWSVKILHDSVKKTEETLRTCDRPLSGQLTIPAEIVLEVT